MQLYSQIVHKGILSGKVRKGRKVRLEIGISIRKLISLQDFINATTTAAYLIRLGITKITRSDSSVQNPQLLDEAICHAKC